MLKGQLFGALALTAVLGVWVGYGNPTVAQEKRFDGVVLRIGTWGGPWKQNMIDKIGPKFEALGGQLEFVEGSPQANLAKLVAARGNAPFDIMEILDAHEQIFIESGYLQPVDLEKIPNRQHVDATQATERWVSTWTTQEVICYNADKFKELGLAPPQTYSDLKSPQLEGRIMMPDISAGGGLANLVAMAYASGGGVDDIQPGLDLIKDLKISNFSTSGGQVVTALQTGDAYAAIIGVGFCLRALNAGVPVEAVHPEIDGDTKGLHKYGWVGIMKSSTGKNLDAAHWFINEYLDTDYQVFFAVKSGTVPTNRDALQMAAEDPSVAKLIETDPEKLSHFLHIDYSKADMQAWTDMWNRSMSQ